MTREPADEDLVRRLRAAGCVFAEDEARLLLESAPDPGARETLIARRVAGEPLEHVLGWVDLAGVRVLIDPGVFVPRRRTGVLVGAAVQGLVDRVDPVVLDLCCGCGAVGAAIAARVPAAQIWASDVDPAAVACARRNLPPERVVQGDLFAGLPTMLQGHLDVVVANTPYVPTDRLDLMSVDAREHEPVLARDGGADGLTLLRRVAAQAPVWLRPGGVLAIEIGRDQTAPALAAFAAAGLTAEMRRAEDVDGTAVVGRLPEPPAR